MAISMLKIRRPLGRLIFNMGIAIPGKTVFLIETDPWTPIRAPVPDSRPGHLAGRRQGCQIDRVIFIVFEIRESRQRYGNHLNL